MSPHPETRREEVFEQFHGDEIADPYRWLEDESSAEVVEWTARQNEHTRRHLDPVPGRDHLRRRLEELLAIGMVTAPRASGERLFYTRRDGRQNQPVLMLREGLSGPERLLLDPNEEKSSGTVALDWWYPSHDGRLLAFGYSDHGDEWSTLRILDVDRGELLPERIDRTRYCSLAWEDGGGGFYYTRYPRPGDVPPGEENYHQRVFYHRLGSDPAADPLVFGSGRAITDVFSLSISPDGRYLLLTVRQGWTRTEVFLRELDAAGDEFRAVIVGADAIFEGKVVEGRIYLRTNWNAPRYRVVAVDPEHPDPSAWHELVAERPDTTIEGIDLAAGRLVLHSLREVASFAEIYALDGSPEGEIPLPPLSSITGLGGEFDGEQIFVGYESYTVPPTVLTYSPAQGEAQTWATVELPVDLAGIEVRQVWYSSRDGTRVPMAIVCRRDIALDGDNPTVLTGYGGFNVSKVPQFTRTALLWLELGGVYAVASLRGGAEYGEDWHRAGMLENKQNVFDDFIAAGEYLVAEGYSSPGRLAITGRSNGGLLVGAAMVQRPDLFKAVVCQVPLLDMLRYQHLRLARLWVSEYGSAEDPGQYNWLRAYSPYHNVAAGADYPAVFFTTAWSDSRVDPMHALKMAALVQSVSRNPTLLLVEEEAGHGQGKPLAKLVDEMLDVWSFLVWQLGVEVPETPSRGS